MQVLPVLPAAQGSVKINQRLTATNRQTDEHARIASRYLYDIIIPGTHLPSLSLFVFDSVSFPFSLFLCISFSLSLSVLLSFFPHLQIFFLPIKFTALQGINSLLPDHITLAEAGLKKKLKSLKPVSSLWAKVS